MSSNKTGYFDPTDFKQSSSSKSPSPIKGKMGRKGVDMESQRKSKRITTDMISKPENDLRHTGHIGYDGTMFGDVAFIGDNYDKLPLKVGGKSHSNGTSPVFSKSESPITKSNESELSGHSAWTISSLDSAGSDNSGSLRNGTQDKPDSEVDGLDEFDDFKLPDLGLSMDLDFGPSFMDEMMKALSEKTTDDFTVEKKEEKREDTQQAETQEFKENTPVSDTPSRESSSEKEIRYSWGSQEELLSSSSDELKHKDDSDKKHGGQKRRSKLKLTPFKEDKDKSESRSKERHSYVKQLSASDEKQLETAIAMANQIAQEQLTPKSPKSTDEDDGNDTPSRKSKFSFKFPVKKTSPQPEKRTFSDELARSADANEDIPPEAQEAYNMLVVRGSVKEKWEPPKRESEWEPKKKEEEEDEEEDERSDRPEVYRGSSSAIQSRPSHSRQQRLQRSQEHQRRTSESGESGIAAANRNLKDPQGIPARDTSSKDEESVNPLRMLRAGGGGFVVPPRSSGRRQMVGRGGNTDSEAPRPVPRPRYAARLNADKKEESNSAESLGSGGSGSSGGRTSIQKPSYFRKFQEFDDALKGNSSESDSKESIDKVGTEGRERPDISNPLPLPPRKPLRPSTLNQKPRERKYPLENEGESRERRSHLPQPPPVPRSNGAFDREDEVFSSDQSDRSASPGTLVSKAHIAMRTVHCNNDEIGLNNNLDPFWREEVNFERLPQGEIKYKTSDNVSYEDLMEFALDTGESGKPCREVEAMQKILGKQIAISDCRQALDSTQWDVPTAIKYIKLKMLLSTQLGDVARCKEALRNCSWNVEQAANYLLSNPDYSPECVDV
ncbi:tyrosine-protein kinase PR2 [Lingula anatina]|uniref:Tyrosine-protein kinase PR2 n=1 Tax=Lingula anatina TaxID=7574 RepID=A0A1S3ISF5_LINAN|nr:tyrosine-protein kinase PR2 [Lingula anatina]|eukprot:XP_013400871.1 tyrosine-protein kinase PR2 [Lingula anatina]